MAEDMSKEKHPRKEYTVIFQPMGISCRVAEGQSIMDAAAAQDIRLRSDCGGKGLCGKCAVEITPPEHLSPLIQNELELLSQECIAGGGRLACSARVAGPLSVSVSESVLDSQEAIGKSLNGRIGTGERPYGGTYAAEPGPLGVAIDIGTTTLALYLCDLRSGEILHSAAEANPQRRFGEDVISRIAYCNNHHDGLEALQRVLINAINKLIGACIGIAGVRRDKIAEVTAVGNTTMQHLFAGLHPGRLGVSPYMPESCNARDVRATELGLDLSELCQVHLFPVISGFVGGDTAGVMLSDKPYLRDEMSLIIDIGTNGEIVLGNKDSIWVTSCATGPALEGAHIEHGMRASTGAIETVHIDPDSYRVDYTVIGSKRGVNPRGLCGSGIIDAVAEMVKTGLILANGRLREGLPGIRVDEQGIGREFAIAGNDHSPGQKRIVLTLADVRQVQLAKAALSSGIRLLMRKAGIDAIDRLVLTGAFGARFNWRNAVAIGMLPELVCQADVSTVENAAGRGAVLALLDEREKLEIQEVVRKAHLLELADDPDFAMEFIRHTAFPEAGRVDGVCGKLTEGTGVTRS
jgi:uncharacterized 2Fe-2S/4Fe-4S cluster protein (DUF4445 family)